jgi:hypothetical protein
VAEIVVLVGAFASVAHRLVELAVGHPDTVIGDSNVGLAARVDHIDAHRRASASASMLLSTTSAIAAGRSYPMSRREDISRRADGIMV